MPRRTSRRVARGPRARYQWVTDFIDPTSIAQNGQGSTELLTTMTAGVKTGAVVQRIIGSWGARAESNDTRLAMMFAIGVMDKDGRDALALPDPSVDNPGWLFFDTRFLYEGNALDTPDQFRQRDFDVRSQRKLGARDVLYAVLENVGEVAGSVMAQWAVRTLLKLA